MARQEDVGGAVTVDLIGRAIAEADAAREAASSDARWAVDSRRDVRRAVEAMVVQAQGEEPAAAPEITASPAPPSRRRSPG